MGDCSSRERKIKWRLVQYKKEIKVVLIHGVAVTVHNVHLYTCRVDATVYCGGLDEKVSETVLWELFLQAGPVGESFHLVD